MKTIVILIGLALLAAGCNATANADRFSSENVSAYVERFVDSDYQIVCYTTGPSGISCVKLLTNP